MSINFIILSILAGLISVTPAQAEWFLVIHADRETNEETYLAHSENEDKYSLELYRDKNGATRLRFSMNFNTDRLDDQHCPTYQIDDHELRNYSLNDAPCIMHNKWAEFLVGDPANPDASQISNLIIGNRIIFRFILDNGSYKETQFSLTGSGKIIKEALEAT